MAWIGRQKPKYFLCFSHIFEARSKAAWTNREDDESENLCSAKDSSLPLCPAHGFFFADHNGTQLLIDRYHACLMVHWAIQNMPITDRHEEETWGGSDVEWYLIRTKPGRERWVSDQLSAILPEVFLPMVEARTPRWGRLIWSVMPLFPCYVFAQFDLQAHYFDVKYRIGVQGIVSAGCDPLTVPTTVVEEIKRRGANGVVKIQPQNFDNGERVRVGEGVFRGFEAIFERYLSGAERVAILLNAVEANGLRVVLPSSALVKYS
jgi:transcriptional antiterminator RfaH